MGVELRPARIDEPVVAALIDRLQAWYVSVYGGPDTDPLHAADFAPPRGGFLLAAVDGAPAAIGGFTLQRADEQVIARLRRVFVVPEHRRQGVAGRLLDRLEEEARSGGAGTAVLSTGEAQTAAIALYRSRGYEDAAASGHWAGWTGAVHLAKVLG